MPQAELSCAWNQTRPRKPRKGQARSMMTNSYSPLWFQLFMPLLTQEENQATVGFLARHLPLPRYQRMLDLCCGYGRHALLLAQRGYQVTGLDRDDAALAEAQRCTSAAGEPVTYVQGDMRQLEEVAGPFDAVISMWQSWGFFDEETNRAILRQIHRILTPGGRLIMDLYNRNYYEHHQGLTRREIAGITVDTQGYMQDNRWQAVLTYRNEQGICGGDHMDWQVFTPDEFCAFAAECGFTRRMMCTWADETRAPSPEIARMQIVLERP